MKRRLFLYSLIGALPLWKWFSAISAEVKNAPATPPQFNDIASYGNEKPFRCLVIGDWGSGSELQKTVAVGMNTYAEQYPIDCILSLGDNIYGSGVESVNDPQWKTKYENIYTGKSIQKPWYPILGNHDYRGNIQAQIDYSKKNERWKLPRNFYKLTIETGDGTADFFAIDTNLILKGDHKEMLKWLEKELSASTSTWKIIMGHHMMRSYGAYGNQKGMINVIKPLADAFNVDLYMCGHDHDLQLIKYPEDHFYHLTSGAGGGARDTSYGQNTLFAATNGGCAALTITSTVLNIQILNKHGSVQYAYALQKQKQNSK